MSIQGRTSNLNTISHILAETSWQQETRGHEWAFSKMTFFRVFSPTDSDKGNYSLLSASPKTCEWQSHAVNVTLHFLMALTASSRHRRGYAQSAAPASKYFIACDEGRMFKLK